jgi:hypothetical protein
MHRQTHALKPKWLEARGKNWQEFRTYHAYWLSALFVVAEGFLELGLDKAKVPEITHDHIEKLKLFRNGCFHYQRHHNKQLQFLETDPNESMNWAERLHEQFREYFREYLDAPPEWGRSPQPASI